MIYESTTLLESSEEEAITHQISERNLGGFDENRRPMDSEYIPGYDRIPDALNTPPVILEAMKSQFDKMSDKEYLYAFLKLSQEEKESLMVSEAERRRTFAAHWPIETIVKANDCAKEGFYYTGVADRVQCAFCGGIVRNWERGDVPKFQHKNYFKYCKIYRGLDCSNIPIDPNGLPRDLMTNQLSLAVNDSHKPPYDTSCASGYKAKDPALRVFSKRKETYRRYPKNNPVEADKLCEAGFLYEGIGDKVKCFWCNGVVEEWRGGDDPWVEHAKWYSGCEYLKNQKGEDFIRQVRSKMCAEDVRKADTLIYNKGDVSFLDAEPMKGQPSGAKRQVVSLNELIMKKTEYTEAESERMVTALVGCRNCHKPQQHNTALLPCGHLCVCEECGVEGKRPNECPLCGAEVRVSLRVHLSD